MIRGGEVPIRAADLAAGVRFYVEELGMKLVEERSGAAVIDAGDGLRVVLSPAAARASVIFYTKLAIEEAVAIFENRGIAFEVKDEGGEIRATFHDPEGNALTLAQGR
jgi:catechol 2,3-dioxygenase-like lactoylglutathione lyase family enzyme